MVAIPIYQIDARPAGVCPDLKNLPSDVRRHWDLHRQRARLALRPVGSLAREALSAAVCGSADAASQVTRGLDHVRHGRAEPLRGGGLAHCWKLEPLSDCAATSTQ